MTLGWTLDKLGPMCRTTEDCGIVLQAIAGLDPQDNSTVDREYQCELEDKPPFLFAILKGGVDLVQPEVRRNFHASLEELSTIGKIEEVQLPKLPYGDIFSVVFNAEMGAAMEPLVTDGSIWELVDPESHHNPYAATVVLAKDYINAMRLRHKVQQEIQQWMKPYDAVVTPTMAIVAQPSGIPFREYKSGKGMRSENLSTVSSLCGLPGISLPNGFGEDCMPTGLHLVGQTFSENRLLSIAKTLESRTEWKDRHPSI